MQAMKGSMLAIDKYLMFPQRTLRPGRCICHSVQPPWHLCLAAWWLHCNRHKIGAILQYIFTSLSKEAYHKLTSSTKLERNS